jgi:hypothetical protein
MLFSRGGTAQQEEGGDASLLLVVLPTIRLHSSWMDIIETFLVCVEESPEQRGICDNAISATAK